MNTISIDKSIIEQALSNMQNAINKKDFTDITSNILLETSENNIVLKATDHEIYIKTSLIPTTAQGTIKCAINGGIINNIMKSLNEGEIILEETDNLLLIKQNKSCFKIPIYEINNLPFRQNYQEMEKINIDNELFIQGIKKIYHCCADPKDATNIAMQGILLEIKNNLFSLIATDSRRLGFIRKEYQGDIQDISCILPKKSINEILKLFNNEFEIYIKRINNEDNTSYIESIGIIYQNMEFYTKLINARFPAYEAIIKKQPNAQCIKINKTDFIKAINQINAVSNKVKITFTKEEIILETIEDEGSSASIHIDSPTTTQEDIHIGLTNKYLLECMSSSKYEDLEFHISNPNTAVFINLHDFEELIMPHIL
ncbi:DNA polymerase III subunit beta [Helicobacter sp. MIT 14-3879]|uniref:DNA polymerase III subunit beta n=1 Tax=Helicobacter sp. MIT 14-3879 TaxID=2040649 RepID=UPI000E1E4051|nr:DNA polymerase III subunit beta [Helicobacter sp. MIT 14-3879]RDU61567.1 DNA polymerase III subunit beta [Helicobacter sp. MIT 14-3879]